MGNVDISTIRSPFTPKTFPVVSTTASGSPALPMAPMQPFGPFRIYYFWQLAAKLTCSACMARVRCM